MFDMRNDIMADGGEMMEKVFSSRTDNPIYNTSYPLRPADWVRFRTAEPLSFGAEHDMSFYVHIPFCRRLCAFCEYTRAKCPDASVQMAYVDALRKDVRAFVAAHNGVTLNGFDIGGGTPTALCDEAFSRLMGIFSEVVSGMRLGDDFEPSIEATFDTLSDSKAQMITAAGIHRVSLGMQSANKAVLHANNRENGTVAKMTDSMRMLRSHGVRKINIDLMYGLKGQTAESLLADIETLDLMRPEQVTLYELRTNMTGETVHMTKAMLFECYSRLYDLLLARGYHARFGQNTFSLSAADMGVSSYLRHRMLHAGAYKGFGISAQSMSGDGVAYNVGKNGKDTLRLAAEGESFPEEYSYHLPPEELAAKYLAISGYCGVIDLAVLDRLLGGGGLAALRYADQLAFCTARGLLAEDDSHPRRYHITRRGFIHYGALLSLFCLPVS